MLNVTKISIDDEYNFSRSVDVLNECFGKSYKAWMKASCYLGDNKDVRVWFPKLAAVEGGIEKPQDSSSEWINTLSSDGMIIKTSNQYGKIMSHEQVIRITFAKFPKLPYRYIGTFIYVPELSDAKVTAFKRISTEVDLSQWR